MGALKMEVFRGHMPADGSQTDTDSNTIEAIQHLSRMSPDALQLDVAGSLALERQYYRHLIDPTVLSAEESVIAGKYLAGVDTQFLAGIIAAANRKNDRTHMIRTLHVVNALGKTNLVAHWVRRMTEHPDHFVKSMAVRMLCSLHVNPLVIEKHLESKDPRVRANAIEALWKMYIPNARYLLEKGVNDLHHRVVVNALIGYYLAKVPTASERIIAGAENESPMFRASIAWAMGYTGDEVFLPHLERLACDEHENVRSAAAAALEKLAEAKESR
jgi:HEAT repeat protein